VKTESTNIRFGFRTPLDLAVQLTVDGHPAGKGRIGNASISGALIQTTLALPLHTNLVVTLSLPGKTISTARSLRACVVRIDPDGVGVEWRDTGGADVMDLLERASKHQAKA
jgi:PilZ domain